MVNKNYVEQFNRFAVELLKAADIRPLHMNVRFQTSHPSYHKVYFDTLNGGHWADSTLAPSFPFAINRPYDIVIILTGVNDIMVSMECEVQNTTYLHR